MVLASVALAVGSLFSGFYSGTSADLRRAAAQTTPARPNIVFILTDDMRKDDLKYMRQTRSLLDSGGMSFENAFVSNALCAPSRATIMRGQYAHETGVWSNSSTDSPTTATGGWRGLPGKMATRGTTWPPACTTRVIRPGSSASTSTATTNTTAVPRGWDRVVRRLHHRRPRILRLRRQRQRYQEALRHERKATIHRRAKQGDQRSSSSIAPPEASPSSPTWRPYAPHVPATPAPRDAHAYDGAKAPRLPSFNEANVSDKPPWIQKAAKANVGQKSAP